MAAPVLPLEQMAAAREPAPPVVSPLPNQNQVDAQGIAARNRDATHVLREHRNGLLARRGRDLLSEKYLLHIDGSGDLQWADILYGTRVEIPRQVSEFRKTENLLRPLVDNAVAQHTTMPIRYFAESSSDRRSRERAIIDMLWINDLAQTQDFNGLFADAMYLAMPAGFAPVHAYWRDDHRQGYESSTDEAAIAPNALGLPGLMAGMVDCWVGNPFGTVFDRSARRGTWYWWSYERVLPAQLVRDAFDHVPGVAGLEGSRKIPSAAVFQRIARSWRVGDLGIHGSPILSYRRGQEADEESIIVVCRETAAGVDPAYPRGRLQLIAVPGASDLRIGDGARDHAILLADQELPAGQFSGSIFYSHHRVDDICGKPWVEDLDDQQIALNVARSKRWEYLNRMIESPIVAPGGAIGEDMADFGGYQVLEVEPSLAGWRPRVMDWPSNILPAINAEIQDIRQTLYTIGGYQAASRGEAPGSRIAYRALVALQQADNTIHGPVNVRFRRSACDFARRCWAQFKQYADIGWVLKVTDDEYAYLAQSYVDNSKVSDTPPRYKLVNAFGASPELRAQEVLQLMQSRGADGKPFLSTEEARRMYPDQFMFSTPGDPIAVQRRRAKTVAHAFLDLAAQVREQSGLGETNIASPQVQQAAMQVFGQVETQYPRLRDDDLASHLAALSEVTQDESADPIARLAAMRRQALYYQWQAQMAGQAPAPAPATGAPAGAPAPGVNPAVGMAQPAGLPSPRAIAAEAASGGTRPARPAVVATARG